jgi:hypothetical protein|nr:MAG TPA: 2'-deoxynucleoside 5'-phosphate N-hydrolase 1 [Caudoviricetes sp.]
MKDNEIVKALRCCAKGIGHDDKCENCKVGEIQDRREYIEFAAANVIERLTAENAELAVCGGIAVKIYIAGKITGDPKYREKFKEAAADIARGGHIPLNPADLPKGMRPKDYMRICFAMIDVADAVVFLPDAAESAGARLEMAYCEYIEKEYETWSD